MEPSSIVSKAKTAFHSAAAKAERVFTDIKKSDLTTADRVGEDCDNQSPKARNSESEKQEHESKGCHEVKNLKWRPAPLKTKQDWHARLKNIRIGKRGVEEKAENLAVSMEICDENEYLMNVRDAPQPKGSKLDCPAEGSNGRDTDLISPAVVMKQLAIAVETGKKYASMKDLLVSSRDSSPVRERAGLSFSAMKSLVLREKEEKFASEFDGDEKVLSLINSLIVGEGHFLGRKTDTDPRTPPNLPSLPKDIHGAPLGSFVLKIAEAIGKLKTLRKMASFWCTAVAELRRLWSEGQYVPGIPPDEIPDLNFCLLYQHLQVINCCISRKRRLSIATESVDSVNMQASSHVDASTASDGAIPTDSILYARVCTGELVLRLGADKKFDALTMLETGEPIYTPVVQEGPLLTEDLIKETEEFVLRTRSVGAGCSQLLSDMQAFKAANPGCILEDFVRWYSPPDWMEAEGSDGSKESSDGGDLLHSRGQLSRRMQKEGNLWLELWETAKPVPAVRQTPLFDEDLAVEGILNNLEDIPPSELFEQLFISLLGSGFVAAETTLSENSTLSKLFYECKGYIVATCQGRGWVERIDDICQVYETVEMMVSSPDEVVKMTDQPEEADEPKSKFKKLSLIFGGKDKKPPAKQQQSEHNPPRPSFSSFFSKKPPKPSASSPATKPVSFLDNNDWTVI